MCGTREDLTGAKKHLVGFKDKNGGSSTAPGPGWNI